MSENFAPYDNIVKTLKLEDVEGKDKVLELGAAIRKYVKPGMVIHIGESANAAVREIIRQFWGTKPNFTIVISGCRDSALDLIHCGLATKLITSRVAEGYPSQGRSPIIVRAHRSKSLEVESWSLLTFTLRLMAGAMGVGFMPTKSILGSTMAQENRDSFAEMGNPFGGDKIGLVKSLNPDISIVHGWAADRNGNFIPAPAIQSGQGEWGAFASKNGVIATVEKFVTTKFIRQHPLLVKIPGYFVNSVSVVPFGAHPQGLPSVDVQEFEEYEADYEFMARHWEASKDSETLSVWLKEWVMECHSNDDYLNKLGYHRLAFLRGKAGRFNWEHKLLSLPRDALTSTEYTPTEMMVIVGARIIKDKVAKNKYNVILSGIGSPGLAAWLAFYQLKEEGYDVDLVIGSGLYGYAPRPGDPQLTSLASLRTCKMITDILHTYGVFVSGEGSRCLSVLGAGQIDKFGNMNSTILPDGSYLVGSGGANDAATADEVVVLAEQSKTRYMDRVTYITCPGSRVTALVSDQGIFQKVRDGEFILTGYFPNPQLGSKEEIIKTVKDGCGWGLKVSSDVSMVERPELRELALLRVLSYQPQPWVTKEGVK